MGEVTSKEVAAKAAWLLKSGSKFMDEILQELAETGQISEAQRDRLADYREKAESIAGSALTQTEDKEPEAEPDAGSGDDDVPE